MLVRLSVIILRRIAFSIPFYNLGITASAQSHCLAVYPALFANLPIQNIAISLEIFPSHDLSESFPDFRGYHDLKNTICSMVAAMRVNPMLFLAVDSIIVIITSSHNDS